MSQSTAKFPRRALLVRTPYARAGSFSDAVSVVAVDVLGVSGEEALCRIREGGTVREEFHPVAQLASKRERVTTLLADHLDALLSRPLLSAVGEKESRASAADDGISNPEANSAREHAALCDSDRAA